MARIKVKHPADHENINNTIALKDARITDEGILDVVLVTSYFNFVNRMVRALSVELEDDKGEGFKY